MEGSKKGGKGRTLMSANSREREKSNQEVAGNETSGEGEAGSAAD